MLFCLQADYVKGMQLLESILRALNPLEQLSELFTDTTI